MSCIPCNQVNLLVVVLLSNAMPGELAQEGAVAKVVRKCE